MSESEQQSEGCPVAHHKSNRSETKSSDSNISSGCSALNPQNMMSESKINQMWHDPDQFVPLPTQRVVSSIPKGEITPPHQPEQQKDQKWVYPSEQMFYNAMKKKGYVPIEGDMHAVVAIHNTVNEKTWQHIQEWESLHSDECKSVKLIKFLGRPKDFSPRARFYSLFGYTLPFDRHDWYVDRCGKSVRYVIDFYRGELPKGKEGDMSKVGFYLDVRPAFDDFQSVIDRVRMQFRKWF
eukprot:c13871_g2_i1.p1 GENE.c13871_g2_i1~~c13871_g2_i1.p1  ORF type:complete len:238 (+),score=91.98 c13871_g2_i1:23-736(+)